MKALKKLVRFFGIFITFLWLVIVVIVNPFIIAPKIEQEIKKLPNNSNFHSRGIQLTLNNYQRGFFSSEADFIIQTQEWSQPIAQKIHIQHALFFLGGLNIVKASGENDRFYPYPLSFSASATALTHLNAKVIIENEEKDQFSWQSNFFSPEKGTLKSSGLHVRSQGWLAKLDPWQGSAILPLHGNGELKIDALALSFFKQGQTHYFGGKNITVTIPPERIFNLNAESLFGEFLGKKQYLNSVNLHTALPIHPQQKIKLQFVPELTIPFINSINGQQVFALANQGKIDIAGKKENRDEWTLSAFFPNPPFGQGEIVLTPHFMRENKSLTLLQYQLGTLQQNSQGNYVLPFTITPQQIVINQKIINGF